jgi:hypothetical protein
MPLNHIFLMVSPSRFQSLSKFYTTVLTPLSYTPYHTSPTLIGLGTDYPYMWLKALPADVKPVPTHIAFEAKDNAAVDEFYRVALESGATGIGPPGIRAEHGFQPYYAAYVLDEEGNNVEAVCVDKKGRV